MFVNSISGVKSVLTRIKRASQAIEDGAQRGLKKAGLLIIRESLKIVPVDTGNLRSSWFVRHDKGRGSSAIVELGYTASYAIFVHENLDVTHGSAFNAKHADAIAAGLEHSRGPNQTAQFIMIPALRLRAQVIAIIRAEIQRDL